MSKKIRSKKLNKALREFTKAMGIVLAQQAEEAVERELGWPLHKYALETLRGNPLAYRIFLAAVNRELLLQERDLTIERMKEEYRNVSENFEEWKEDYAKQKFLLQRLRSSDCPARN